jgi:hypothetical protein
MRITIDPPFDPTHRQMACEAWSLSGLTEMPTDQRYGTTGRSGNHNPTNSGMARRSQDRSPSRPDKANHQADLAFPADPHRSHCGRHFARSKHRIQASWPVSRNATAAFG